MCGEKVPGMILKTGELGSPPHVRGKACSACFHLRNLGITPACAGKSAAAQIFRHLYRDHPRMCGEKQFKGLKQNQQQGSPPHVRGKVKNF